MIQDLVHDQAGARDRLKDEGLPALLDSYDLTSEQKAAFDEPGWPSFTAIGIPPIFQLLLMLELSPHIKSVLSMQKHVSRIRNQTT